MLRKFGFIFIFCAIGVWILPLVGLSIQNIGELKGNDKVYASLAIGSLGIALLFIDQKIQKQKKDPK